MHEKHIKKRYYIRTNTPSIAFFPIGFIGVIFILLTLIYGSFIFAQSTIQDTIYTLIKEELSNQKLDWVNVEVDGQSVFLSGEGSLHDESRAIEIVRSVKGDTWIGKQKAPIHVTAAFTAPQPKTKENQHIINTCPKPEEKEQKEEPIPLINESQEDDAPSSIIESCNIAFKNAMKGKTINFSISSSQIKDDSFLLVDEITTIIKSCPSVVYIEGHTDNSGNFDANMALSFARAQSVRDALIERGVNKDQLIPKGYGPTRPKTENTSKKAQALNRRIEFHILNEGENP